MLEQTAQCLRQRCIRARKDNLKLVCPPLKATMFKWFLECQRSTKPRVVVEASPLKLWQTTAFCIFRALQALLSFCQCGGMHPACPHQPATATLKDWLQTPSNLRIAETRHLTHPMCLQKWYALIHFLINTIFAICPTFVE